MFGTKHSESFLAFWSSVYSCKEMIMCSSDIRVFFHNSIQCSRIKTRIKLKAFSRELLYFYFSKVLITKLWWSSPVFMQPFLWCVDVARESKAKFNCIFTAETHRPFLCVQKPCKNKICWLVANYRTLVLYIPIRRTSEDIISPYSSHALPFSFLLQILLLLSIGRFSLEVPFSLTGS